MTRVVRRWLAIIAYRHLTFGLVAVIDPHWFGAAFTVARHALPIRVWGTLSIFVAVLALLAALIRRFAFAALLASSSLTSAWMLLFILAAFRGEPSSLLWALFFSSLLLKDWNVATRAAIRPPSEGGG